MFRSLSANYFGSVDERAEKLIAVKIGLLKKKSAASAIPAEVCASAIGPGSRTPGVKSFSKFDGQFHHQKIYSHFKGSKTFKRLAIF